MTSFFAAYDALCEEGTASPVCKALDEVADISVTGRVLFLYISINMIIVYIVTTTTITILYNAV